MPAPYFQKTSWPAFAYQGRHYDLSHLDEHQFEVTDSAGVTRRIAVTYSDHCFTRSPKPNDDPTIAYQYSDRRPGHFCFVRYQLSLGLRDHLVALASGKVWTVEGDNFAAFPVVTLREQAALYGIMFSLDRVSGLPVHLHMRIKSAYLVDQKVPVTYGSIRFVRLVALRMQNRRPGRILDRNRRVPRLPE